MHRDVLFVLTACALLTASSASPSAPRDRDRLEAEDLRFTRAKSPHAVELLEQGEGLLDRGDPGAAEPLLRQASAEAPLSSVIARRHCEALSALGRREEALAACHKSLYAGASPQGFRETIDLFMTGPRPPTTAELGESFMFQAAASKYNWALPSGHGARCRIAERIGDYRMLKDCVELLQKTAPNDQETLAAQAAFAALRPPWWLWLGWLAIVASALATFVHALGRVRWRLLRRAAPALHAALLAVVLLPAPARAQVAGPQGHLSKFTIDPKDPSAGLPSRAELNKDPVEFGYLIMDLAEEGEAAAKRDDLTGAVAYYRALAKIVPDRSIPFAKMCELYGKMGDLPKALDACGNAMARPGVRVQDYALYLRLQLGKKAALLPSEVKDVDDVVEHLRKVPEAQDVAEEAACQLALRLEDASRLTRCVDAAVAKSPDSPKTISYQWALAVRQHDYFGAKRLVERAKKTDMGPEWVQRMDEASAQALPVWIRWVLDVRIVLGLVVLVGAVVGFFVFRKRVSSQELSHGT